MAKNKPRDHGREGMVDFRTQLRNKIADLWVKRNAITGRFMAAKNTRYKGVKREK